MMDSTDNGALPTDRATTPDGAEPVVSGKAGIPSALAPTSHAAKTTSCIKIIPDSAVIGAAPWEGRNSPTALSYWFPIISAAGLPVPRTIILPMPEAAKDDAWEVFDGKEIGGALQDFASDMRSAASGLGVPFFLRTDLTSGKHEWKDSCFVTDPDNLASHILTIAYYSEMGWLPWDENWVVREVLPTIPVGVCPRFGNMPVCKEFRFFVNGGEIECFHPYWPRHALEQGGCDLIDADFSLLCNPSNEAELRDIASRAGFALGGRWSVDLLETERGWFLTDMAEAEKSFHWRDCPTAQAIEAGTAETGTGSVHESAVHAPISPSKDQTNEG